MHLELREKIPEGIDVPNYQGLDGEAGEAVEYYK
jgi:hypothetical protein